MGQGRLNDLALLILEREVFEHNIIDFDDIINQSAAVKARRIHVGLYLI